MKRALSLCSPVTVSMVTMTESFGLIMLDIMLPDVNCWRIVQSLRGAQRQAPALFLTAKDINKSKSS